MGQVDTGREAWDRGGDGSVADAHATRRLPAGSLAGGACAEAVEETELAALLKRPGPGGPEVELALPAGAPWTRVAFEELKGCRDKDDSSRGSLQVFVGLHIVLLGDGFGFLHPRGAEPITGNWRTTPKGRGGRWWALKRRACRFARRVGRGATRQEPCRARRGMKRDRLKTREGRPRDFLVSRPRRATQGASRRTQRRLHLKKLP